MADVCVDGVWCYLFYCGYFFCLAVFCESQEVSAVCQSCVFGEACFYGEVVEEFCGGAADGQWVQTCVYII